MARTKVVLTGLAVFPTSTKFHAHERSRGTAFMGNRIAYILKGNDAESYPPVVALESDGALDGFEMGETVKTMHPVANKNLPDRTVIGVVFPDGDMEGEVPAKGASLPQWEVLS